MHITVLGSGTSIGVPYLNCPCEVCTSTNPKDKRLRASIRIDIDGNCFIIDCGPDFRQQMMQHPTPKIDAVLLTHEHYDHVSGLDDLRPFGNVNIFAEKNVIKAIKRGMPYCFPKKSLLPWRKKLYPGVPLLSVFRISTKPFEINGIQIQPIRCYHHKLPILGFRIQNFAYLTDISSIDDSEVEKIMDVDVLIVDALRITYHFSHFTLQQAQEFAARVRAKRVYFTHLSHQIGLHDAVQDSLPAGQFLCYDGMEIKVD